MVSPERGWPVALENRWRGHEVWLRPLRVHRDKQEFLALRAANADWNRPWDSTLPTPSYAPVSYAQMVRQHDAEARAGQLLPFAVEVDGALAGQMHLFAIQRAAAQSGSAGYWIAQSLAGRGITPFALAMLIDHAFGPARLHRVEVNIRPENDASLRVVAKLGLRCEGLRERLLHINGAWCDHLSFAVTSEELAGDRMVDRLRPAE